MGFWDSYWKWMFSDEESFIDLEKGIFYRASGNTRSVRGLFKNYEEGKGNDGEAMRILQHLIEEGKITKQDILEFRRNKEQRMEEEDGQED